MNKPTSTYRIQFHKKFNLKSLDQIIPYLIELEIGAVYASPIFQAIPGSTHGYDVTNPLNINPEIGTEAELLRVSGKLKAAGILWIQDIVPNHMAFHPENTWLKDVLKKGRRSGFSNFFDADLDKSPLMAPFLAKDLDQEILEGKVKLMESNGEYFINYGDFNWPVNEDTKKMLDSLDFRTINANKPILTSIIEKQYYRLCNWQETDYRINYRRFFTVNGLISLNMQDPETFSHYHQYIFELVKKDVFHGLRIDHVDGLADPGTYLKNLRKAVGNDIYIVVEKILESGEEMPVDWGVQGSTGYDFLATVNNLFTNQNAENSFNSLYRKVTGKQLDPTELAYQKKKQILFDHMQGELDNLLELFLSIVPVNISDQRPELKQAIGELLLRMPVYRYYNYNFPLSGVPSENVKSLLLPIMQDAALSKAGALLYDALLGRQVDNNSTYSLKIGEFFQRCMQYSGPLMAKGVEDTLMYTYNRFIGHNEVGDATDAFGLSIQDFHEKMSHRLIFWPLSMNASSTHDTKRGEDVRARLNVLSDLPAEWEALVENFTAAFNRLKNEIPSFNRLHDNDVYLLIQTIIGSLPIATSEEKLIGQRLEEFIPKALRESKKRSHWANPNVSYEEKLTEFSQLVLDHKHEAGNLIEQFLNRISDFSVLNSLSQLTLKCTCPGIPDIYQGTELWDLSLVDPDNRRPVDYTYRKELLKQFLLPVDLKALWAKKDSAEMKIWLTKMLLSIRKSYSTVFEEGKYIPIEVRGKYKDHICAFARYHKSQWLLTVVPVGLAQCCKVQNGAVEEFNWKNTTLILPKGAPSSWENFFTGKAGHKDPLIPGILISQLFTDIPLAVIKLLPEKKERSAGVLMHISSLPSRYGIGDFGQQAFRFVDFLWQSGQRYWQILPLNPVKKERGYSPYSSSSVMAGNPLFIDLQVLLKETELNDLMLPEDKEVDFEQVEKIKQLGLDMAYQQFRNKPDEKHMLAYRSFCETEKFWLDDFSTYTAVQHYHQNQEWINWPEKYKNRDQNTIGDFVREKAVEIDQIKWAQFIFFSQWQKLKRYANKKGISIIGDLPFYPDYDSVDVWAAPENFMLDKNGEKKWVAAVPPDYFSKKGQLWGMPIYNWKKMKKEDFSWWHKRLKQNIHIYDLVRLDHFRAFSSFWQVDADHTDAVHGFWKKGVGFKFFKDMKRKLGRLPFIAEDLGEISEAAEILQKKTDLPGMKVLQFAFGEDVARSNHIPHNFANTNCILYSGTHDNNTTLGWFRTEADIHTKKRISKYSGSVATETNINSLMLRLCYASIAKVVIIPMQDILSLDEHSRMNTPGEAQGNWKWRVVSLYQAEKTINWLKKATALYGR